MKTIQVMLTPAQAATILGTTRDTIYEAIKTKRLKAKQIGRSYFIHYRELGLTRDDLIDMNRLNTKDNQK